MMLFNKIFDFFLFNHSQKENLIINIFISFWKLIYYTFVWNFVYFFLIGNLIDGTKLFSKFKIFDIKCGRTVSKIFKFIKDKYL